MGVYRMFKGLQHRVQTAASWMSYYLMKQADGSSLVAQHSTNSNISAHCSGSLSGWKLANIAIGRPSPDDLVRAALGTDRRVRAPGKCEGTERPYVHRHHFHSFTPTTTRGLTKQIDISDEKIAHQLLAQKMFKTKKCRGRVQTVVRDWRVGASTIHGLALGVGIKAIRR